MYICLEKEVNVKMIFFLFFIKVRQHPSGAVLRNSRFFYNILNDIGNIYFNLISLNNQIKILFDYIKHYMAAKQ